MEMVALRNGSGVARFGHAHQTGQSSEADPWAGLCLGSAIFITHLLQSSGANVKPFAVPSLLARLNSLFCSLAFLCPPLAQRGSG